jgi:hypothetical protein
MAASEIAPGAAERRRIDRNDVVRLFGTPSETVGSVNEPRQQHHHGFEFNELWIYDRPKNEASQPRARRIYWQRYDFIASERVERDGHVVRESEAELLARLAEGAPAGH